MKTMVWMKRGVAGCALALTCAFGAAGCNSAEESSNSGAGSVEQGVNYMLPTGDAGKTLGVSQWNLSEVGLIEAIDADGGTMGKFQVLDGRKGIVSLNGGEIRYDEQGSIVSDTLSDFDRALTEAVRADLIAASVAVNAEDHDPGAQKALEWVAFACCNAGTAAILYQWWSGGWTPYCSFQQQSGTCSGLWECGPLAADRGCQYWL
jgi:hypothetical protein